MSLPDPRPLAVVALVVVATLSVAPGTVAHEDDSDPGDGDVHVHESVQHPLGQDGVNATCATDGADPAQACAVTHEAEREKPDVCIGGGNNRLCLF